MTDLEFQIQLRLAAFEHLKHLCSHFGETLTWEQICVPFQFNSHPILLANRARGMFKPSILPNGILSLKSTVPRVGRSRRYEDIAGDDFFIYRFQGTDPNSRDNLELRFTHENQLPLIYFYGLEPSIYRPIWPAYVTSIDQANLLCRVAASNQNQYPLQSESATMSPALSVREIERRYTTVSVKQRLHQSAFRLQVIHAYRERCCVCKFPKIALLEAAHILPDRDERGRPEVTNGLCLCSIHHDAFDRQLVGISPDAKFVVGNSLLASHDGPMLEHLFKALHNMSLFLPSEKMDHPNRSFLEERFASFIESERKAN